MSKAKQVKEVCIFCKHGHMVVGHGTYTSEVYIICHFTAKRHDPRTSCIVPERNKTEQNKKIRNVRDW